MIAHGLLPVYHAARRAEARIAWRWVVACAVTLVAAAMLSAAFVLGNPGQDSRVLEQIAEHRRLIAEADQSAATWRAKAGESARTIEGRKAVGEHPDWGFLVLRMAAAGGKTVAIEQFAVEAAAAPPGEKSPRKRWIVTIAGLAPKQTTVVEMVAAIEEWNIFDRVRLVESKARTVRSVDAVAFKLEAVIEEGRR